jgi:NAD-dependent deacetylase
LNVELARKAANYIRNANKAVALTGAGISVPSGIPDFRSPGSGLWDKVDPIEVATIDAFRRNPEKFYAFMGPLSKVVETAKPNPAHMALAEWERLGKLHSVITQNIDNMHQRAGSRKVIELHGNGAFAHCMNCRAEIKQAEIVSRLESGGGVPRCDCGGVIKPDVVLFGESLPFKQLVQAERDAESCDVMVVVGSSLTVAPASMLPQAALAGGAAVIVINLQSTYMDSQAAVVLREKVEEALPAITEMLKE